MRKADPIRDRDDIQRLKNYYRYIKPNPRNYLLIIMGLNTALRISDILNIKWKDIFDDELGIPRKHIYIEETKTGKSKQVYINANIQDALSHLDSTYSNTDYYLFSHSTDHSKKISRIQAYRIIREAANYYNLEGTISCHSLRKTFGYQARVQGADTAVLVDIFNHSSFEVTKRYLGINQDDQDMIYKNIMI